MLLNELKIAKAPLRYGTYACCLSLVDSSYTKDILEMRNSDLGEYLNRIHVSEEEHEQWLASRLAQRDILDFVVLIDGKFGGTVSLTEIEHGKRCEFGRMIIPNDGRRVYTLAVEFLGMSFAFEVMGMEEMYCAVVDGNESILRLHLRHGWKLNPEYDREAIVNGHKARLTGLSISRTEWPNSFAGMKKLVKRLLDKDTAPALA
jgi:UDP-4-amino-4,6-dideoxy-N-acetyl-beta-L-altrosamine N-acetyltransferase